jgi:hypothetical protein
MIKYFSEASVVKMFSCDDISGMNDMRLISSPIEAPSHEFDEIVCVYLLSFNCILLG